jgi:hypothetical protein
LKYFSITEPNEHILFSGKTIITRTNDRKKNY